MKIEWVLDTEMVWHKNSKQPDRYGLRSEHKACCGLWVRSLKADFRGTQTEPGWMDGNPICATCADIEVES